MMAQIDAAETSTMLVSLVRMVKRLSKLMSTSDRSITGKKIPASRLPIVKADKLNEFAVRTRV
jgi:hypothetical protein